MKIFERIFLFFYSLFIGLLSLLFLVIPFRQDVYQWTSGLLDIYQSDWKNIMIPLFFLVVSVSFLISGFRTRDFKKNAVIRHTAYGEINISLDTIESMAQRSARDVQGLKEIRATVYQVQEGVIVHLTAMALSDVNIPEATVKVQQNIKDYIEKYTGVEVREIKVNVENLAAANRGRVE